MYLHSFLYDDKRKYIDSRNIINFQIHVLFLAAGILQDKAREKGLVNVCIFVSNPLLYLIQDNFKITETDEKKVLKIISLLLWFKKSLPILRY